MSIIEFARKGNETVIQDVSFSAERLPVAPFDRVTEPSSVKILRESRSELLKPLLFIAEFCLQKQKERTEYESDNNGKFRLQGD